MTRSGTVPPMADSSQTPSAVAEHHRRATVWRTPSAGVRRAWIPSRRGASTSPSSSRPDRSRRDAERIRSRLLNQVDERRNPRTRATSVSSWTSGSRSSMSIPRPDARTRATSVSTSALFSARFVDPARCRDSGFFYSELRRCRDHCGGRRSADSDTLDGKTHVCRGWPTRPSARSTGSLAGRSTARWCGSGSP